MKKENSTNTGYFPKPPVIHTLLTKLKKHVSIENFTNNHHLSLYMELV
jgi:hypothetical protein